MLPIYIFLRILTNLQKITIGCGESCGFLFILFYFSLSFVEIFISESLILLNIERQFEKIRYNRGK